MTTILHIDSSAKGQGSTSRQLTADAMALLKQQYPGANIITRDLTKTPLPHIGPDFLVGIFAGGEFANHETVLLSDKLVEELMSADILVIGAPMYNFNISSQLKAWIDHVARAGKTFKYTPEGVPVGLATGKRAIVAVSTGGVYSEGPMQSYDHVGPYMKQVLGFIGITDVTIIRAEKQAMGPDAAAQGLAIAQGQIARMETMEA